FLQITRRRFLNEWEAFKKVISRRNIRRRITIPLTLSNLKLLRSEERFSRNAETDLVCRLLLEKKKKKTKNKINSTSNINETIFTTSYVANGKFNYRASQTTT